MGHSLIKLFNKLKSLAPCRSIGAFLHKESDGGIEGEKNASP
jgi:hypothetical protein